MARSKSKKNISLEPTVGLTSNQSLKLRFTLLKLVQIVVKKYRKAEYVQRCGIFEVVFIFVVVFIFGVVLIFKVILIF